MSIEIIQVITLDEFKETGVAGHYDDDTIKAAINTSYIRLNALCNQNIKKRWNIEDTTDPLYLKEEYKEITKQAFFLQTEYNLVNNLNLSSEGSQQESLGSWSHSYNNPKEKPFICDGVQDMLQQATLFIPVKSVSLNVANNKCIGANVDCGELPAGDKYDLSFVRWGEANAKFLPKNIGIEFANKILITDENGYIRTGDASYIIEEQILVDYLTKTEAQETYGTIADIENLQSQITTNTDDIDELKEERIVAVDITPRTFENETLNSGTNMFINHFDLPVDYNFEILGVVSTIAKMQDDDRYLPMAITRIEKENYIHNIYLQSLIFNDSTPITGNLTINIKLLIRKV